MTRTHRGTWDVYERGWGDVSPDERSELLQNSVAEGCGFVSPDGEGHGRDHVAGKIKAFQERFPGATIRTYKFIEHHDRGLAHWTIFDRNGFAALQGNSVAHFGEDGLLIQVIGFWELPG